MVPPEGSRAGGRWRRLAAPVLLLSLFVLFLGLEWTVPLRTAVRIGADEGFNLAKATLCLKGYKLYSEVWSDQPPLHTFLITQILRHVSPSALGPRLLTVGYAVVLLMAVFVIGLRIGGLLAAGLTTAFLIASPGFVELSSSCMLEIPGLAPAVVALAVLLGCGRMKWGAREIIAGVLFGIGFQMKPNGLPLLLIAGIILYLSSSAGNPAPGLSRVAEARRKKFGEPAEAGTSNLLFLASLTVAYGVIGLMIEKGAYFTHFQQSWVSHVAAAQSAEYGSAADYAFDCSILLKNWDMTVPALAGVFVGAWQLRRRPMLIVPLAWLGLSLAIFGTHKPWWPYYYIHIAIPLCLCGGIGIVFLVQRARVHLKWPAFALLAAYALCAAAWMGGRVYLQITGIRNSPQVYSELVLTEMERLKPFTKFMFASEPVYSFHAGIPMPPNLAVISLKRMWSGEMTNARIAEEMRTIKPGLILVANDSRELPFSDLIQAEYRLIYQDSNHNLYANRSLLIDARGKGSFE